MNQGMNAWIDHLNTCLFLLGSGRGHSVTPWKGCYTSDKKKRNKSVGEICVALAVSTTMINLVLLVFVYIYTPGWRATTILIS